MPSHLALIALSPSWGGLEVNLKHWATWLTERGYKISVLAQKDTPLAKALSPIVHQVIPFKLPLKHLNLSKAYALAQLLKQAGIQDLLIGHPHQLYVATQAKRLFYPKLRLIHWQQMQISIAKKDLFHNFSFQAIDIWISPLDILAKKVVKNTKIKPENIHILPLPIDLQRFTQNNSTKAQARTLLQLPAETMQDCWIGTIGRLDKQKGQAVLIEALHLLKQNETLHNLLAKRGYKALKVVFIGNETIGSKEHYANYLQQLVVKYNLQNEVFFRPFMPQAEQAFRALDIFVMASLNETFGMVTIEAMASQVSIIGTNTGGTPEILDFGNLGELFSPNNAKELAQKILIFLEKKQEVVEEQVAKVQQTAIQKYGHEKVINQFIKLLQS